MLTRAVALATVALAGCGERATEATFTQEQVTAIYAACAAQGGVVTHTHTMWQRPYRVECQANKGERSASSP